MIFIQLFVGIYLRFFPGTPFDRSFGSVEESGLGRDLMARAWKRFEDKIKDLPLNKLGPVLDEICHTEKYDDALQHYLKESPSEVANLVAGSYHIFLAWQARSAAWAHEVSQEQINGFYEHLELSQSHLTQEFENSNLASEALSQLIIVAMGFSDIDYVTELYEQCMKANPKHIGAKLNYFKAISTRWLSHGDNEPMREFCLEQDHGEMSLLMELVYWMETYRDYYYFFREENIDEDEARERFSKDHKAAYLTTLKGVKVPEGEDLISIYTRNYLACLLTVAEKKKHRNRMIATLGNKFDYWSWLLAGVESERTLKWFKFANML